MRGGMTTTHNGPHERSRSVTTMRRFASSQVRSNGDAQPPDAARAEQRNEKEYEDAISLQCGEWQL
jgi:hypothetical protein